MKSTKPSRKTSPIIPQLRKLPPQIETFSSNKNKKVVDDDDVDEILNIDLNSIKETNIPKNMNSAALKVRKSKLPTEMMVNSILQDSNKDDDDDNVLNDVEIQQIDLVEMSKPKFIKPTIPSINMNIDSIMHNLDMQHPNVLSKSQQNFETIDFSDLNNNNNNFEDLDNNVCIFKSRVSTFDFKLILIYIQFKIDFQSNNNQFQCASDWLINRLESPSSVTKIVKIEDTKILSSQKNQKFVK